MFQSYKLFNPVFNEISLPFPPTDLQCFRCPLTMEFLTRRSWTTCILIWRARWFRLVYIMEIDRGPHKLSYDIFVRSCNSIRIVPLRLRWKGGENFLSYTLAIGRDLLQLKNPPPRSISNNWHGALHPTSNPTGVTCGIGWETKKEGHCGTKRWPSTHGEQDSL